MSESLFGSTELLAKGMGITEKELFKQMEAGTVMAAEVLPKLAKEYRKAAMANGAFDAASKKTRAELNRFMTQLSLIKNEIFTGGFGEGLSYMFKGMADLLKSSRSLATVFGVFLKSAIGTLTVPFQLLGVVVKHISKAFNIAESSGGRFLVKMLGVAAALYGVIRAAKLIKSVFGVGKTVANAVGGAATGGGVAGAARMSTGVAGMLAGMVVEPAMEYGFGDSKFGKWAKKTEIPLETMFPLANQMRLANKAIQVMITVNDGKVEGLIDAKVVQANTENLNSLMASGTK